MAADINTTVLTILRWFHILAGIAWIGHLYFFNFVNSQFQLKLDKELKPKVNPELMHRALWWFRWGSMMTFLFGWFLFLMKYGHGGLFRDETGAVSDRAMWILYGGLLGTVMWFNVWFVIWPAQKKILGWVKAAQAPAEMAATVKRATLFSKINTYLSGPMLFGMVAANNYYSINLLTLIVFTVIGLGTIWGLYKLAPKVGHVPA
jgi:uncharacterized membrane protein